MIALGNAPRTDHLHVVIHQSARRLLTITGLADNRSPIAPIDEYHSFAKKAALNDPPAAAIALRKIGSLLLTIQTGRPAPSSDFNMARAG